MEAVEQYLHRSFYPELKPFVSNVFFMLHALININATKSQLYTKAFLTRMCLCLALCTPDELRAKHAIHQLYGRPITALKGRKLVLDT